jgi:hypothetical protein
VWTARWGNDSELVSIGTYNPSSEKWASDSGRPRPKSTHEVAGLLALNDT